MDESQKFDAHSAHSTGRPTRPKIGPVRTVLVGNVRIDRKIGLAAADDNDRFVQFYEYILFCFYEVNYRSDLTRITTLKIFNVAKIAEKQFLPARF